MEPAVGQQEYGSQDTSRLSCAYSAWYDRQANHGGGFRSMDLSRCKKRALTCVRALSGFRVTTLALALRRLTGPRQFLMVTLRHRGRHVGARR